MESTAASLSRLIQPVLNEDVEFHGVVQRFRPVRQIRRNEDNIADGHHDLVLVTVSESEFQHALDLDGVSVMFAFMCMARHRIALLEADLADQIRLLVMIRRVIVPLMGSQG